MTKEEKIKEANLKYKEGSLGLYCIPKRKCFNNRSIMIKANELRLFFVYLFYGIYSI